MSNPNRLTEALDRAKTMAADELPALAAQIIQWQDTGLLRSGPLHELAAICKALDNDGAYRIAESLVNRAALNVVTAKTPSA